jgi:methyl-accepting chemotaxis protein
MRLIMGSEKDSKIHKMVADLATQRDELRLQMHLLAAEAKDEWEEVEEKWQHLESKMGQVGKSAKESAGEIGAAGEQLVEEIGNAYKRIRKAGK